MEYIVTLNGKPIEDATPEELEKLNKAIAKAAKDVFGFVIDLSDTKQPGSERVREEA